MMCKVNFVPTVKEIMPQQSSANAWHWHYFAIFGANGTHKGLDRSSNMYIITFTFRTRRSGDLVNAQQGGQKVQARCPQAARHAESTSERGDRSPVPNWRFLRSRRRRTGQVRDASARHRRQAVSHSVRYSIRLLPPYLLSSGSRLSARWPLRVIAREARAPKRPQAYAGRSGFCSATPSERSFAAPLGLGRCYPGTVRYKCSSPEYRTRTEAAGKKTSLNPVTGARKTAEPGALTSAYEDLRRQATECSTSGGLGMAILLDHGMVAWMLACSWVPSTNAGNSLRCPTAATPLPNELRREIVLVMTAMALKQAPEVYP
jgi:hypothetical protein